MHLTDVQLAIFDIDGTLVDTTELFLQAFEYTMNEHKLDKKSREELREIISVSKTLMESYQTIAPLHDFEKLLATHHGFRAKNIHLAKPFPHTISLLKKLKEKNIHTVGFTNRVVLVTEILQETGIEKLLETVITAQDAGFHKPHPAGIILLLKKYAIPPHEAIMVGDTEVDILAGKAAGVAATIGVTTGFSRTRIQECGADYVIDDLQKLLPILGIK